MTTLSPVAFTWSEAQAGARSLAPISEPFRLLGGMLAAADLIVVAASSMGAFLLRHGGNLPPEQIAESTLLALVLSFNVLWLRGCYSRQLTDAWVRQIARAVQGWTVVMVLLLVVAYFTKTSDEFSRIWAITWFVMAAAGMAASRLVAARQVRRWRQRGKLACTVAVIDMTGNGDAVARRLINASAGQMRLVGVFGPQRTGVRKNGVADLLGLARLFRIDEVVISVAGSGDADLEAIIRSVNTIPTNVRLCPELPALPWTQPTPAVLFGQPMLTISHRPMTGWNCILKRAEDLLLSSILVVAIAPVLALIALAIRLDSPGPVLFRQKRAGFNNNPITVFKFRTMFDRPTPETDVRQAQRNDPRVTRVGRFLRRSSLDELPQLLNVLRGDMSLVGPRPHAVAHNDQYAALIGDYLSRHRVQPGITGWAQVNGCRGETDVLEKMQRRVEYDLAYIESWSLSLDVRILVQTGVSTLLDRNAY